MPRTKTRARQRRVRAAAEHTRIAAEIEALWQRMSSARTFEEWITANDELVRLLRWIANSPFLRLWDFFPDEFWGCDKNGSNLNSSTTHGPTPRTASAGAKVAQEDIDATRALIAQLVAPRLAGNPPRRVQQRT